MEKAVKLEPPAEPESLPWNRELGFVFFFFRKVASFQQKFQLKWMGISTRSVCKSVLLIPAAQCAIMLFGEKHETTDAVDAACKGCKFLLTLPWLHQSSWALLKQHARVGAGPWVYWCAASNNQTVGQGTLDYKPYHKTQLLWTFLSPFLVIKSCFQLPAWLFPSAWWMLCNLEFTFIRTLLPLVLFLIEALHICFIFIKGEKKYSVYPLLYLLRFIC